MPRATHRSALVQEIFQTMELVIRLIEVNPRDDLMSSLDDLWEVYGMVLQCRYIAPRGVSAGRHLGQCHYELSGGGISQSVQDSGCIERLLGLL